MAVSDGLEMNFDRYIKALIRRLISRRTTFRGGSPPRDGRITLLTVDYHVTEDVMRLVRSFRRFVDPQGRVVVVQNGEVAGNRRLRSMGNVIAVNRGFNVGHGLGLDWGMRQVSTQYTLICDPDAAILSGR